MSEANNNAADTVFSAKVVYFMYLGHLIFGITAIIGVIIAYVNRQDASDWLQTHYRFQIRTFWMGAFYLLVGLMLLHFIIGWLVVIFLVVWLIVRCAKGLKYLDRREAYPDPLTWLF